MIPYGWGYDYISNSEGEALGARQELAELKRLCSHAADALEVRGTPSDTPLIEELRKATK